MIRRSLGPAARARTMQTIEKGKERTRYPLVGINNHERPANGHIPV